MDIQQKSNILASPALNTKKLVADLDIAIGIYSASLAQEQKIRQENRDYVASGNGDSPAVNQILAGLTPPEDCKNAESRKAWLTVQRGMGQYNPINPELHTAIEHQHDVEFQLEDVKINIELARQKISALKTVITLRTAQISFLASSDVVETQ
jgi:hypothetical protein